VSDPSAESPGQAAAEPRRLGRYRLVAQVGDGALGPRWASYVTEGDERGRLVSLRLVRLDAKGSRLAALVGSAGRHAQSLRHPKLLAVLDVVRDDDELGIVSEYMDGEDLGSLLRSAALTGGPIPPSVALAIVRDTLETLAAVVEERARRVPSAQDGLRSSLHGGFSPDGVFVATFGEALLTELGVAGAACRQAWFAEHMAALPYRAPEQLEGPRVADQRADVYSVGVILWEMLANRSLFGGADRLKTSHGIRADTQSVLKEVLEAPVPSLETVQRPGAPVPADVAALVARATARLPAQRFQSIGEMLDASDQTGKRGIHRSHRGSAGKKPARRAASTDRACDRGTHRRQCAAIRSGHGRPRPSEPTHIYAGPARGARATRRFPVDRSTHGSGQWGRGRRPVEGNPGPGGCGRTGSRRLAGSPAASGGSGAARRNRRTAPAGRAG
jgi:serine/threonine protein kinase